MGGSSSVWDGFPYQKQNDFFSFPCLKIIWREKLGNSLCFIHLLIPIPYYLLSFDPKIHSATSAVSAIFVLRCGWQNALFSLRKWGKKSWEQVEAWLAANGRQSEKNVCNMGSKSWRTGYCVVFFMLQKDQLPIEWQEIPGCAFGGSCPHGCFSCTEACKHSTHCRASACWPSKADRQQDSWK